jgi:hypothetical protein
MAAATAVLLWFASNDAFATDAALSFNGTNQYVSIGSGFFPSVTNSFTIEFWASPTAPRALTPEGTSGVQGSANQRYAIFPDQGALNYGPYDSGVGVSVGINGVTVFEHSTDYMPSPLRYVGAISGWTHVAVVYSNSLPRLFLNGTLVRTGLASPRIVHPSANLAETGRGYGYYQGSLGAVRLWAVPLDEATIQNWMNRDADGSHPAAASLIGSWRLDENAGAIAYDSSALGHDGQLVNAPAWIVPGPPVQPAPVVTRPATNILNTSAALNGSVNPQGRPTTAWFEFDKTTTYSVTTIPQDVGSGSTFLPLSQGISLLDPESVYHFRCLASNAAGVFLGFDRSFHTGGPPSAQTQPETNTLPEQALLVATVNPNGLNASTWFEWGTNSSLENRTATVTVGPVFTNVTVTNLLGGLAPDTAYFFRIIATNIAASATGAVQSFATPCFTNTFSAAGGIIKGSVIWGDFNRDGRLDVASITAQPTNNGGGVFLNDGTNFNCVPAPFGRCTTGYYYDQLLGSAAAGDLNNDGALDIIGVGTTWNSFGLGGPATFRIYLQTNGMFTNLDTSLPPLNSAAVAVADYDNDGLLDFIITGGTTYYSSTPDTLTNILCRNLGNGAFQIVPAGLPAVYNGALAWGDFDNDGQPDLLIMGNTGTNLITTIYRNNHGTFTDIGAALPGLCGGAAAWVDYDNDGQFDLFLLGQTNTDPSSATCFLYHNQNGVFTLASTNFPAVAFGSLAWGDFDSDGYLDLAIMGSDPSAPYVFFWGPKITKLLKNQNGTSLFTEVNSGIAPASGGDIAWGDFDNDGRLDIAVMDMTAYYGAPSFSIYRNLHAQASIGPQQPLPPSNPVAQVTNNAVLLNWSAGSDTHTPTPGLTYNVRIGSSSAGSEIVPPHSDSASGRRQVPKIGNAEHRLFSVVNNLPIGTYYWSVQTVNNSFVGSPWAPEQTFVISNGPPLASTLPASNILCCSALLSGTAVPGGTPTRAWLDWGPSPGFGNSTPAIDIGTGVSIVQQQYTLAGLQPLTTYYVRFVVSNTIAVAFGTNQSFTTEGPAPLVQTLEVADVTYKTATLLGFSPLFAPKADYFFEWGTSLAYGQAAPIRMLNSALQFDGMDDILETGSGKFPRITNDFTLEIWARPTGLRLPTAEAITGNAGFGGQRYAIFPEHGAFSYGTTNDFGAGVSIGTNGVSVIEHTANQMPSVLVYPTTITDWTHVAVTYSNHVPRLYLNGQFARIGMVNSSIIHASADMGGTRNLPLGPQWYGDFQGALQEFRLWDVPLDGATIQSWMNQPVKPNHPFYSHLQGYWPLDEGQGDVAADIGPRGNSGQLLNGSFWTGGRGFASNTFAAFLSALSPGMTYYFRAVGSNSGGISYGGSQTFTTLSPPQVLSFAFQPNSTFTLQFTGAPSSSFRIEASTNLSNWITLSNLPPGVFQFTDFDASNWTTRFYRIRVP